MLRKLVHRYCDGKTFAQPYWARLHYAALRGLNISVSHLPNVNGEEKFIKRFLALQPEAELVVFDVGANVGKYAQCILDNKRNNIALFCFEPSRATFEQAQSNLAAYENVNLYNFGFSDAEASVPLFSNGVGSELASVYPRELTHHNIALNQIEHIELKTLDEFCENKNITHIDLLKLDVEGHELSVLRGAKNMLSQRGADFIQFEFGGANIDSRTFFRDFFLLLNPNYLICRLVNNGLTPIDDYSESFEIFIYTNFVAISRNFDKAVIENFTR
jgi:FkbM family methyltransferase